jgi:hypothetical protein
MPICFVIYLDSLCFFTLSIIVLALEVKELKLEVLFCDVFFLFKQPKIRKINQIRMVMVKLIHDMGNYAH